MSLYKHKILVAMIIVSSLGSLPSWASCGSSFANHQDGELRPDPGFEMNSLADFFKVDDPLLYDGVALESSYGSNPLADLIFEGVNKIYYNRNEAGAASDARGVELTKSGALISDYGSARIRVAKSGDGTSHVFLIAPKSQKLPGSKSVAHTQGSSSAAASLFFAIIEMEHSHLKGIKITRNTDSELHPDKRRPEWSYQIDRLEITVGDQLLTVTRKGIISRFENILRHSYDWNLRQVVP